MSYFLFTLFDPFERLGVKSRQFFHWFLEELKQRKTASEIFWPSTTPGIKVNPERTDPSNPKDIGAILATEVAEGSKIWGAHYE